MRKVAEFIVKKRWFIFVLFIAFAAFCVYGTTQQKVEYSITAYLPQETDTRLAIDIMDEEFTTFGTATVMLRNVSYKTAERLSDYIREIDGVKSLPFENTEDYYKDSCALFNITFEGDEDDARSVKAYDEAIEVLSPYDMLISAELVNTYAQTLKSEINRILVLAVVIIIVVLMFTSQSFAEVAVFLITFGLSALFNMGTNYWLGTISFISSSVCIILQLALALDYAIILANRFAEQKKVCPTPMEAMIKALTGAIPEIAGSSLTTIAGLLALTTMTLRLGMDLGMVLAKSIVCSILTVFLLMPGLMLLFSKPIDKTTHKNFVPKISFLGKMDVKLRYVITALFVVVVGVCSVLSFNMTYVYSQTSIDTDRPSSTQAAQQEINSVFGYVNTFVVLVPAGDYNQQLTILNMLEEDEMVTSAIGIANQKLTSNNITYYLTEGINYKQFASFLGVSESVSGEIYSAYAFFSKDDTSDGLSELAVFAANKDIYYVSLLDLCDCAFEHNDFISAYLYNNQETYDNYLDIKETVEDAEAQLIGKNYVRMVFNIDGAVEGEETFAFIDRISETVKGYCPEAIFAGDSMSSYDLNASFGSDNIKISLITVAFIFIILIFTLRSWGLPVPLVITIQGAIFINFSYYTITGTNLFFFVYLIVSSIQMGATIDYAIVTASRFEELKQTMDKRTAIVESLNQAFPTILTSGTIMAVAGFLIGYLVSDPLIATLGMCLGRGVIISIICVMVVLPALLYIFDKPLSKTKFKTREKSDKPTAKQRIDGRRKKLISDFIKYYDEIKEEKKEEVKEDEKSDDKKE